MNFFRKRKNKYDEAVIGKEDFFNEHETPQLVYEETRNLDGLGVRSNHRKSINYPDDDYFSKSIRDNENERDGGLSSISDQTNQSLFDSFPEQEYKQITEEGIKIQHENNELPKRAKYNAKMDRFLTNGIIIVSVLLVAVLLIAFLV